MKAKTLISFLLILLMSNLLVIRCDFFEPKNKLCLSGMVVDVKGKPVEGVDVSIGGQGVRGEKTSKAGEFTICAKPNKDQRYVLNLEKLGYGFVSKIYFGAQDSIVITMERATVVENINPNDNFSITDNIPNTASPAQPDYSRMASPLDTIPFVYDANGRLIAFGAPPEVQQTYNAIDQFQPQQVGATVTVEPDALEDPTDTRNQNSVTQAVKGLGQVTGSVSTVDVYSPDGMPGDYTTRLREGGRGFMVTYGAVDVNFYSNGKPLQLKKGKFATLSIPVDTLALIYGEKLPPTIPLLVYDKETGVWQRDGNNVGKLNKAGTAYEAKVSHFSVFNMDEEFDTGEAVCYKMCIPGPPSLPAGSPFIQITGDIPGHVKTLILGPPLCTSPPGGCSSGNAYAINNMKADTPIGVRLLKGTTIMSSYVFVTGSGGPGAVNAVDCNPPNPNYNGCGGPVIMDWASTPCYMGTGGIMTSPILAVNETGTNVEFSILHIQNILPDGSIANVPTYYQIQYKIQPAGDDTYNNAVGWSNLIDWDPTTGSNKPTLDVSTHWIVKANAVFDSSVTGANQTMSSGAVFFRVLHSTTETGPFTTGSAIYALHLPSGDLRDSYELVVGLCRIN